MQRQVRSLPTPVTNQAASNAHTTSELGMVTAGGKVIWGRYAQITVRCIPFQSANTSPLTSISLKNNCEMDGCVNAVLLV